MPAESLPPDPDSVEKWRALPQNKPSRDALPPMTGGLSANRALLFGIGIFMLIVLIASLLLRR